MLERVTIIDISKNIYVEFVVEKKLPEVRKGKISGIKIKINGIINSLKLKSDLKKYFLINEL